jgi:DnaJ-domain-containing protein 1
MQPRTLKRWLTGIAVVYLLFPRDLIPDFLGRGLGLLDDLLVIGALTWFYRKQLRQAAARATGEGAPRDREAPRGRAEAPASEIPFDPYAVLGVAPSASWEAIRAAYRARMNEYHPDKVAHLGEDLQKLAHRKAQEIQRAYQQLRR